MWLDTTRIDSISRWKFLTSGLQTSSLSSYKSLSIHGVNYILTWSLISISLLICRSLTVLFSPNPTAIFYESWGRRLVSDIRTTLPVQSSAFKNFKHWWWWACSDIWLDVSTIPSQDFFKHLFHYFVPPELPGVEPRAARKVTMECMDDLVPVYSSDGTQCQIYF